VIEGINSRNDILRRDIGTAAYKLGKGGKALEWYSVLTLLCTLANNFVKAYLLT
jgi:hypothetical protein